MERKIGRLCCSCFSLPLEKKHSSWTLKKTKAVIGFEDGQTSYIPLEEMKWARKYIKVDVRGAAVHSPKNTFLSVGDVVAVDLREGDKPGYRLCQIPEVSGAVVVMDPHTGRVLAMQGGFSFRASQFNRGNSGSASKRVRLSKPSFSWRH